MLNTCPVAVRASASLLFAATALYSLASPLARAADGPVTAEVGGRIHMDFGAFDNDNRGQPNPNDTELRRLWLDVSGKLYGLNYKVEGDFSDTQNIIARDVYLKRSFGKAGALTVGQFKQHFSLDDRVSSNYGSFMERGAAATTLAPLYRLGVAWQAAPGAMTWAATSYSLQSIDVTDTDGYGLGTRVTWAPPRPDADVLHLGLSLAHERNDKVGSGGRPALRIRPRPAGHLSNNSRITLIDFASGRDVDVDKWALEYGQVRGPLSWQSEWSGARFRDGAQQGQVQAWYGLLSWFVTGQSRRYDRKTGRF